MQKWKEYQLQCLKYLYEAPPIVTEGKFCNRTFDNYACWPDGLPGTYVNVSCPWYLPWANTVLRGQVYRFCTSEGTWLLKENSTLPWRNLSECEASDQESLSCRLVFVMMQYCVAANYYWLLVEGMYLYTLLVLSVFSEQRIFRLYLFIGWGVPMLFVILWGTVKYLYEDEGLV
uniref:Glucagon like peptide 1 receptor n=1 Tax=Bubo bubo TaxID=30461 RepID=A0A8C0EW41_BUBBB